MKTIINPEKQSWKQIGVRPQANQEDMQQVVTEIFSAVQLEGDTALRRYTKQFDGIDVGRIKVSQKEIENASSEISTDLRNAINQAYNNIYKFHNSQKLGTEKIETSPGVVCWQEARAIEKVGIYIPGGTAPLFSTVLMLGIPAVIAGCSNIVLCTPPDSNGNVHPAILYVASLLGITSVIRCGGIQAIAGMVYGTESITSVYKIFGPGNQYVTAAKEYAFTQGVAIDMPAGPSELLVLVDETCIPAFVAADLLSQAEHGEDSQVICVVLSEKLIPQIWNEITQQVQQLPRKEIALKALEFALFISFEDDELAADFVNEYAPEHYIISVNDTSYFIDHVRNAGSVFIGNYTPESAGDYASGTNHTLPTNGFSKAYSGVNVDAYIKKISFQEITAKGIQGLGPTIEIMAETEGLQAHKNAVSLRLNALK
jgi:histidinol dehydrogenase